MPQRPIKYGKTKSHFFQSLDLNDAIKGEEPGSARFTATKLIGTLGPSAHDPDTLEAMIKAGMAAARLDLTWGPLDFHIKSLQALNVAMMRCKKLCAVLVDTLGREIMIRRPCTIGPDGWPQHAEQFTVSAKQQLILTTRDVPASATVLPVTYAQLHEMVTPGDSIYIGRYLVCGADSASLYLEVLDVQGQDIICEAKNDAEMTGALTVFHMERSSDSLSNLQNTLPLLSEYDKQALATLGSQFEIDFVCLSYARTREDVQEARDFLDSCGMTNTKILANLQTRQALLNFKGMLSEADGVVLSRGNLGLDVPPEKMAIVQKHLITTCNFLGKPVVITRVLDSMVNNPRPTRAEATDIANCVLDGADAIQTGAETLRGSYPVEVLSTLGLICRTAERVFDWQSHYDHLMDSAVELEAQLEDARRRAIKDGTSSSHQRHRHSGGGGGITFSSGSKGVAFGSDGHLNGAGNSMNGSGNGMNGSEAHLESDADTESLSEMTGHSPGTSYGDMSILGATAAAMTAAASYGNLAGSSFLSHTHQHPSRLRHTSSDAGMANGGSAALGPSPAHPCHHHHHLERSPHLLQKLESLASAAVRAASMVAADMIVVYTSTGGTARLVAKYRPPMPILTLVVPRLVSDSLHWKLEGRATARSCQLTRGLLPMLANPGPNGDAVLEAAVLRAAAAGLVGPRRHVVVLQQLGEDYALKVMTLGACGTRISKGSRSAALAKSLTMRTTSHYTTGRAHSTAAADASSMLRQPSYSYADGDDGDSDLSEDGEPLMMDGELLHLGSLGLSGSISEDSSSVGEFEARMRRALTEALEEQGKGAGKGLDVDRLVKDLTAKAVLARGSSAGMVMNASYGASAALSPSTPAPPRKPLGS